MNIEINNVAGSLDPILSVSLMPAANIAGCGSTQVADVNSIRMVKRKPADQSSSAADRKQRFSEFIAEHMNDVYKFAYWLSGNRNIAEDVSQEALLRAWRSFEKLQDPSAAKGWLLTIVRRENARYFERKHPKETEAPDETVIAGRVDYDTSTEAFVLRSALQRLPPEYREPLLMQVVHGYAMKEIAERLGLSDNAVGMRLYRARRKMRELLTDGDAAA